MLTRNASLGEVGLSDQKSTWFCLLSTYIFGRKNKKVADLPGQLYVLFPEHALSFFLKHPHPHINS